MIGAAVVPATALGDSDEEVQETLRGLQLDPPMLYPSALPPRLRDAEVSLFTEAGIAVSWDRGTVSAEDDNRVGFIGLSRSEPSQLRRDIRSARSRGYRPRTVRLRGRRVWRLCGHVCGYAWIERGRYYGVYGIYYVGDESGATVARDQRTLIRALRPLR